MNDLICAGLFVLASGAYGWAWLLYTRLANRIEQFILNHFRHLEDRVKRLEARSLEARLNESKK